MLTLKFTTKLSPKDALPVTIVIGAASKSSLEDDFTLNVTIDGFQHTLWCVNPLNGIELALAFINTYLEGKGISPYDVCWLDSDG